MNAIPTAAFTMLTRARALDAETGLAQSPPAMIPPGAAVPVVSS